MQCDGDQQILLDCHPASKLAELVKVTIDILHTAHSEQSSARKSWVGSTLDFYKYLVKNDIAEIKSRTVDGRKGRLVT